MNRGAASMKHPFINLVISKDTGRMSCDVACANRRGTTLPGGDRVFPHRILDRLPCFSHWPVVQSPPSRLPPLKENLQGQGPGFECKPLAWTQ